MREAAKTQRIRAAQRSKQPDRLTRASTSFGNMEKKKLNRLAIYDMRPGIFLGGNPGTTLTESFMPSPTRYLPAISANRQSGDAATANMLPSAHVNCPEVVPFPNYESDVNLLIITGSHR